VCVCVGAHACVFVCVCVLACVWLRAHMRRVWNRRVWGWGRYGWSSFAPHEWTLEKGCHFCGTGLLLQDEDGRGRWCRREGWSCHSISPSEQGGAKPSLSVFPHNNLSRSLSVSLITCFLVQTFCLPGSLASRETAHDAAVSSVETGSISFTASSMTSITCAITSAHFPDDDTISVSVRLVAVAATGAS